MLEDGRVTGVIDWGGARSGDRTFDLATWLYYSPRTCADLYELVRETMDAAHLEGELKAEIVAEPERFVVLDPALPRALLDLKQAGKKLFLATNSEWHYTAPMISYVLDRYLQGSRWRDLFDLVIVQAKKPGFFVLVPRLYLGNACQQRSASRTEPTSSRM